MKLKHHTIIACFMLAGAMLLSSCSNSEKENVSSEKFKNLYTTVVQYSGENDSAAKYLEIAERSAELIPLLEENVNAFVVDAYNYQTIDDEGTPLYEMNGMDYPVEIDPAGHCIRVSKNYFQFNPIEAADGSSPVEQIIYDDLTLNILVPEKYRDIEEKIIAAYREQFYFEKVKATNDYNEMAGIESVLDISEDSLNINIIYVKDGQKHFTFRSDCAPSTDNWINDPIVMIYTSNIHCNYAHSIMSQWLYFYSDEENAEGAYQSIKPYVLKCGAENSIKEVSPAGK